MRVIYLLTEILLENMSVLGLDRMIKATQECISNVFDFHFKITLF